MNRTKYNCSKCEREARYLFGKEKFCFECYQVLVTVEETTSKCITFWNPNYDDALLLRKAADWLDEHKIAGYTLENIVIHANEVGSFLTLYLEDVITPEVRKKMEMKE